MHPACKLETFHTVVSLYFVYTKMGATNLNLNHNLCYCVQVKLSSYIKYTIVNGEANITGTSRHKEMVSK